MHKDHILKNGNGSLAISAIWGVSGAAFGCPLCWVASGGFLVNSIRQKFLD